MLRKRLAAAVRDERGFTLTELLVALVIALLVAGAGLGLLQIAIRAQPATTDRGAQIQSGRVMIERLSRELRQGESVSSPTASGLQVVTYVDSATCGGAPASLAILCRVTYACGATACTRSEADPAPGSPASAPAQVVRGIAGPAVFSYEYLPGDATPAFVGIRLGFAADDGDESVTLEDGVALRNHLEGS